MKVRHRLLWMAAGIAAAVTIAYGQGISIDGPLGHSTSGPPAAPAASDDTISYWTLQNNEQPQRAAGKRPDWSTRFGSSIRYGSGFQSRRYVKDRNGPFYYYQHEYSRRRFDDLRPNQIGSRFDISHSNYDSGISYTTSFQGRRSFGSSIRYGFR